MKTIMVRKIIHQARFERARPKAWELETHVLDHSTTGARFRIRLDLNQRVHSTTP